MMSRYTYRDDVSKHFPIFNYTPPKNIKMKDKKKIYYCIACGKKLNDGRKTFCDDTCRLSMGGFDRYIMARPNTKITKELYRKIKEKCEYCGFNELVQLHHIDFNKLNNNPENLKRLTKIEHMDLHAQMCKKTIHREDVKQKSKEAHKTPEYREKISKLMSTPEMRKKLSDRAKKQWENEDYKDYMKTIYMEFFENNKGYREKLLQRLNNEQKKYWTKEENRKEQSERLKTFFEGNPEAKELLSKLAKDQWDNKDLKAWRSEKTKEQWTPEFREKRKKSYDETYYDHTISFMKHIQDITGDVDQYDEERIKTGNRNLLTMNTFVKRFFNNNYDGILIKISDGLLVLKTLIHV